MKRLREFWHNWRLFTGSLVVCPKHGEVKGARDRGYYSINGCSQCFWDEVEADVWKTHRREREERINEMAEAMRLAGIEEAIRRVVGGR